MAVPPPMTIYGFAHHFCPKNSGYRAETSVGCCPHVRTILEVFSIFSCFFAEKSTFPSPPRTAIFCISLADDTHSTLSVPLLPGVSFSRKPIVPFARNPIVSRPWSIVSRSSRELLFVLLPPSSALK